MLATSVATSPALQHVDREEAAPHRGLARFPYQGPASGSVLLLPDTDPRDWRVRRPGEAVYDSEALVRILRQQIAEAELSVTDAQARLAEDLDLRPAIGLLVSLGLSALFWISSIGILKLLT